MAPLQFLSPTPDPSGAWPQRRSNRSQNEMHLRWWMVVIAWCVMTVVLSPASLERLMSFTMKSNYTRIINVFVLDWRRYLLVWSWVGVCVCISGLLCTITWFIFILIFIFTLEPLQPFFFFFPFYPGSERACRFVCRYMCNWAKTILKGDIRDGWITENLLKRDNPSCTLIRHTPWFSNGIFSIISAVTVIASSHSAQLGLSSTPNSFSLPALPPPSSLPMTLHKLRAIQVALVMLIGLGMAYAYPPSRVWALIRAKQSPAHPSYSTPAQVQTLCSVWCGPQLGPPQCWLFLMCQIVPGLVLHRQGD